MHSRHFTSYRIEDRSYLSIVKRDISRTLRESGFSGKKAGEIDIIVSEMTSNLVKHADAGGSLLYRVHVDAADGYFEVLCIDDGPGMSDTGKMMQDGMSSSNTLGQGLGAIRRLSDVFHIYSRLNWGTVLYARKNHHETSGQIRQRPMQMEVVQEAIPGEKVCGDGYFVKELPEATHIFVGDGLGHGEHAFEAVKRAIEAFRSCDESEPGEVLRYIHERVKKTRGLVGSIAILDHRERKWRLAGIGNIATRIYKGLEYRNHMPHNGIIGLNIPTKLTSNKVDAENYQTILITSDGIRNKWDLADYPFLLKHSPAIIAAAIFKDNARHTDDMTVFAGKLNFSDDGRNSKDQS